LVTGVRLRNSLLEPLCSVLTYLAKSTVLSYKYLNKTGVRASVIYEILPLDKPVEGR